VNPAGDRTLALNSAQLRALRNWSPEERPSKTLPILLFTPSGPTVQRVRAVVSQLIGAHQALRSRLVPDAEGGLRQLVLSKEEAVAELVFIIDESNPALKDSIDLTGLRQEPVDPEERALRCRVHTENGRVRAVLLSVSHLFADGVSQQLLYRTLDAALSDPATEVAEPSLQAADFAGDRTADVVRSNTRAWKDLLRDAPRYCVFTPGPRPPREEIRAVRTTIPDALVTELLQGSRALGVSPYTLWATAMNLLVARCTAQHSMVFKTQLANRSTPAEFGVVAQLAQAAFIPVAGAGHDTLAERAAAVFDASLRGQAIGMHDTLELLDWLDHEPVRRGVAFRPAFEINYAASIRGARLMQLSQGAPREEFRETQRTDPWAASADLAVAVWQESGTTVVTLQAKPSVWRARSADRLLDELLATVAAVCREPAMAADDVPVEPIPGSEQMLSGHLSGAKIDGGEMQRLLLSHPRVHSATFTLPANLAGGLSATVVAGYPADPMELMRTYTEGQRWMDGTVVPAELAVSVVDERASA
jgi:hypothetical protein